MELSSYLVARRRWLRYVKEYVDERQQEVALPHLLSRETENKL